MSAIPRFELFKRADLETFGFGQWIDPGTAARGLQQLARLQTLHRSGFWGRWGERHVEQSFVERVFGDVFGYQTLLSSPEISGSISSEIIPQLHVPIAGTRGVWPDFTLGSFRADSSQKVVCGELKGPAADLDAPQADYGNVSAVEQAMHAARAADAIWCIVSNTHEVRLYRVPDITACERVDLLTIASPLAFRRAYALLSRKSLLGDRNARPLLQLHNHCSRGESMLVPERANHIRLVQRVKLAGDREVSFTELSRAFLRSIEKVPELSGGTQLQRPKLQDEQLALDDPTGIQRIAANRAGLLVYSRLLPQRPAAPPTIYIDPADVVARLASATAFAWVFFSKIANGADFQFEWSFEDLGPDRTVSDQREWTRPGRDAILRCQPAVSRITHSDSSLSSQGILRETIALRLTDAITELFFPFEGVDDQQRLCRLEPTVAEVAAFLEEEGRLQRFGYYEHGIFMNPLAST